MMEMKKTEFEDDDDYVNEYSVNDVWYENVFDTPLSIIHKTRIPNLHRKEKSIIDGEF